MKLKIMCADEDHAVIEIDITDIDPNSLIPYSKTVFRCTSVDGVEVLQYNDKYLAVKHLQSIHEDKSFLELTCYVNDKHVRVYRYDKVLDKWTETCIWKYRNVEHGPVLNMNQIWLDVAKIASAYQTYFVDRVNYQVKFYRDFIVEVTD